MNDDDKAKTVIAIPQGTLIALVVAVLGAFGVGAYRAVEPADQSSGGLSPDERSAIIQLGTTVRRIDEGLRAGKFREDPYTGAEAEAAHTTLSERISRAHTRITDQNVRFSEVEHDLEQLQRQQKNTDLWIKTDTERDNKHLLEARDHIGNIERNTEFRQEHQREHRGR
jgi:hypothetical protein